MAWTYCHLADWGIERHLSRHRQADAQGKSLMTRKRLYKDAEGRVVNKVRVSLGDTATDTLLLRC